MQPDSSPFDWRRMFLGELPPLFYGEIVVRTAFLYLAAVLLLRLTGKRGMSALSPFEQVILIALGSAVGDPMFYPEVPLLYAVAVMAVIIGMQRLFAAAVQRSERVEDFVEGRPVLLVRDGRVLQDNLNGVQLSRDELYEGLRVNGVEFLEEVRLAYFEVSGELSVYTRAAYDGAGTSVLPARTEGER